MPSLKLLPVSVLLVLLYACSTPSADTKSVSKNAQQILGDSNYLAMSYGGYREKSRDVVPTLAQQKEDLKILSAMGVKLLRTYNVHLPEAENLLKAISELQTEDPTFEMYLMLGAWIDCKNAWTGMPPDHNIESERNAVEIAKAVDLAKAYPNIVKIIAVGNEAMVKWATSYYVQPGVILKWVKHLQALKQKGELPADLWITSSDNFASWGGGDSTYHVKDLEALIAAVDYLSIHTYPMHDTHYNPAFWGITPGDDSLSDKQKIDAAMLRAKEYAMKQYQSVQAYVQTLGIKRPIHIGETGWASFASELYGHSGSKATDEYKMAIYYNHMRRWTNANRISCFYFEAFDEQWKDAANPLGSENHFGLINLKSQAKYALWPLVDAGIFKGLTRNGMPITKTFGGNLDSLMQTVKMPGSMKK